MSDFAEKETSKLLDNAAQGIPTVLLSEAYYQAAGVLYDLFLIGAIAERAEADEPDEAAEALRTELDFLNKKLTEAERERLGMLSVSLHYVMEAKLL